MTMNHSADRISSQLTAHSSQLTGSTISVIIPIYRVEKYLVKCLDSVTNQTYKNLEIILIDDGSPDNCPKICDEFAAKDPRIRVIHQENQGVSAARNHGIEIATGEFIAFIDGDDYVAPEYFETLLSLIIENDADMSISRIEDVDESGEPIPNSGENSFKNGTFTSREIFEKNMLTNSPVQKLYKRKLFYKIRFPEDFVICEDAIIAHHVIDLCGKISVTEKKLYYYVRHSDSATGDLLNARPESIRKMIDSTRAYLDRYEFFKQKNMPAQADDALINSYAFLLSTVKYRHYFKNKNYKPVNRAMLQVIRKTLKLEKLRSLKIFAKLLQETFLRTILKK